MIEELNEQQEQRRQKLQKLRGKIEPYGHKFARTGTIEQTLASFKEGDAVRLAGRLMAVRAHGKTVFGDLKDQKARIQLYVGKDAVGEEMFSFFSELDLGDIVGVEGELFKTRTGEPTLKVKSVELLAKSLRPLPEKWHGLTDVEIRYRQRYLDLVVNDEVRRNFELRSKIVSFIRQYLDSLGYLEVETPMMQPLAGGAAANPFVTHYEALGTDMYLRIAPELYLKRLLVGGFEKVYELNRSFRNEGISRRHNPEFTMLEVYAAYEDRESMMELTESLICGLAEKVFGKTQFEMKDGVKIDFARPWKRYTLRESVEKLAGIPLSEGKKPSEVARERGIEIPAGATEDEILNEIFETKVEPLLIQPTFITEYPASLCPLAKTKKGDPSVADRFELFIRGQELANAYSELNDPEIQLANFKKQAEGKKDKQIDFDYVRALECGMPPAGGLGIGIDRLIMVLTSQDNIRDVILFPQLKPESR